MIEKIVIINRAVPGSGKTTITNCIVSELRKNNISVSVHSTDDYFMVVDRYVFDIAKLGIYHEKNFERFKRSIIDSVDVVVCDNTNIAPWQTEPYTRLAREHNYKIVFITLNPRELEKHIESQQVTVDKPNAHGVNEEVLKMMMREYYIFDDLLNKNSVIDFQKHMHYKWNNKLNKKIPIAPEKHFDSDHVIRILPTEYKEAQKHIGSIILRILNSEKKLKLNIKDLSSEKDPLYNAILYNDIDKVKFLLENSQDTDKRCENGLTPLEFVLFKGNYELVQQFYQFFTQKITGYILDNWKSSLHLATYLGEINLIKNLIKKGSQINTIDQNGDTPLHIAVVNKHMEIVKYLIKNNATMNIENNYGNTPLLVAIQNYNLEVVEYLISLENKKKSIDENFFNRFYKIINEEKDLEFLDKLFEATRVDVNSGIHYRFFERIFLQNSSLLKKPIVKSFLKYGLDVNNILLEGVSIVQYVKKYRQQYKWILDILSIKANNNTYDFVSTLSKFASLKPIKYITHSWDFNLVEEYKDFEGFLESFKKQYFGFESELHELSPNLHKKIYTFLVDENPSSEYSWCSKIHVNIGWSSLKGLKEHCDKGNKPDSFRLPEPIIFENQELTVFKDIVDLFKQEIEVRENFKSLETLFVQQKKRLGTGRNSIFKLDLVSAKLNKQFYTDVEKFGYVLDKVFSEIETRKESPNIEVSTWDLKDLSIEIRITQIDSVSSRSAHELLQRSDKSGDLSDIKNALLNLCDWSVEGSYEDEDFRVNILHSNNVKDIIHLDEKPKGFTHVFRFYKL